MRIIVFALLLLNLLFFVWARGYLGTPAGPDALRVDQQLLPERIRVVSRGQAPRSGDRNIEKVVDKKAVEACHSWRDLAAADADSIEGLLADKFPAHKATRSTTMESNGYWVYIPPSASKEEANQKTLELQQQGVQDFFVVQAGGPNRFAISLGTYHTEEAANAGLAVLRAKGVKTAKVGERITKTALNTLEITGPENDAEALRQAIAALLPKALAIPCAAKNAEAAQ